MILINNFNLTSYQLTNIPLSFKFSDYPGSLVFSSFSEISLINPADGFLDPYNNYSPLHPLSQGKMLDIILQDEKSGFIRKSLVIGFSLKEGSELILKIQDPIQNILDKSQVICVYENKTPIEIIRLLVESYGLKCNLSRYGVIKQWQEDEGLIFDYQVGIDDQLSLIDSINQLCLAGFLRITIFMDEIYFIGIESFQTQLVIYPQEVCNIPTPSDSVKERYGGGSIQWLGGTQNRDFDRSKGKSELNLNYSSTENLTLINGNGAESLFDFYLDESLIGNYYSITVLTDIIDRLKPGDPVLMKPPIVNKQFSIYTQIIERQAPDPYNPFVSQCTFEVKNG